MNINSKYEERGVSAHKTDVKNAIKRSDPGLFPGAFCKAIPDILTNDPHFCLLSHSDGAGTKAAINYMLYKETGDASVFQGIAQDSLVMNLDDLACVGALGPFILTNTIARNKKYINAEILSEIIRGYESFCSTFPELQILPCGGETADLGDLTNLLIVDSTLTTRMQRSNFIDCHRTITPGLDIIGVASYGQAIYEDYYNSGIGSNGLTSARHELLHSSYREKYPETFDPNLKELAYTGQFFLDSQLTSYKGKKISVGEALSSPTRTYAPLIKRILKYISVATIKGLIHNTGGGLTKCLNFGQNIHYIKNNLLPQPPIFDLLLKSLAASEMVSTFNLGQRLEILVEPKHSAQIIEIAAEFDIESQVIGHTEPTTKGVNELTIKYQNQSHNFLSS